MPLNIINFADMVRKENDKGRHEIHLLQLSSFQSR